MIIPTITKIELLSPGEYRISWEYPVTTEDIGIYKYKLYRSSGGGEDEGELLKEFNHLKYFIDTNNIKKIWVNVYYRIETLNTHTNEIDKGKWTPMMVAPDLEAMEIVRRNDILLSNPRRGIGVPIAVFKLKIIGPHCPDCWDFNKQKIRSSSCDSCYKTGIQGGYYEPEITWANLTPPAKVIQIPQWGEMEANEIRIFMSNKPILNPKDLIYVSSRNCFYSVEQIETTTRRDYLLHQLVSASGIERKSIVYNLLKEYPDLNERLLEKANHIKTGV